MLHNVSFYSDTTYTMATPYAIYHLAIDTQSLDGSVYKVKQSNVALMQPILCEAFMLINEINKDTVSTKKR